MRGLFKVTVQLLVSAVAWSDELVYRLPDSMPLEQYTFANPGAPWPRYINSSLITFWRMGNGPFVDASWDVGMYTSLPFSDDVQQLGLAAAAMPVEGENTASTVQWRNGSSEGLLPVVCCLLSVACCLLSVVC